MRSVGVIVSERHIITAAHAVRCAGLPLVHTEVNGRAFTLVVERDDYLFGSGRDIARLEIASAETFELGVAPPVLTRSTWEGKVFVFNPRTLQHGWAVGDTLYQIESELGDSGSPVYSAEDNTSGYLVGIVVRAGVGYSVVERISPYWLEGT